MNICLANTSAICVVCHRAGSPRRGNAERSVNPEIFNAYRINGYFHGFIFQANAGLQVVMLFYEPDGACCPVRNVLSWVTYLKHNKNVRDGVANPVPLGGASRPLPGFRFSHNAQSILLLFSPMPVARATFLMRNCYYEKMVREKAIHNVKRKPTQNKATCTGNPWCT